MGTNQQPNLAILCECGCGRPEALRAALPGAGFQVVACATPETLMERILQRPPDLLVYQLCPGHDLDLPILRLVRRTCPALPVIVVAETPSLETQRRVQELGSTRFLVQPIEAEELRDLAIASLPPGRREVAPHPIAE